jgi:putative FmdB family regulatory protein
MAYYEFACQKCHEHFTVKQSFAEHEKRPKPKCPHCGSRKVSQLLSAVHVRTSKKS